MSYIIKKNEPLVNLKLTDLGRQNLSNGLLNFKYYVLGDSEMNYTTGNIVNQRILRPVDNNPGIQYSLSKTGTGAYSLIDSVYSIPSVIHNSAAERGFFINNNEDRSELNADLMKMSNVKIDSASFDGSNILECYADGDTVINNPGDVIEIGDYLFVKLVKPNNVDVQTLSHIETTPLTYLWYTVQAASGYTITVDRELPDFTGFSGSTVSQMYVYKGVPSSGTTIVDNFDNDFPTAYWENGIINFSVNGGYTPDDVPIWNFNVYQLQNAIGVDGNNNKDKTDTYGELFSGAYTYLRYADNNELLKIGIIHYTNNTVSNFYGEGFFNNTLKLYLPNLMWHKKVFSGVSTATSIGYTFICDSTLKNLGNGIMYYDLIDQESVPTTIGKVLIDQKIVIIEDPEIIAAMSIKSNRNFTLPTPTLTMVAPGSCPGSSQIGSIKDNQTMYVSYMLGSKSEGIWYQPCENIASITNVSTDFEGGVANPKDVMFYFDNTIVNNFAYLFKNGSPYGYTADTVYLLIQVVDAGEKPSPTNWNYLDATNYLGLEGCLTRQAIGEDMLYQLVSDTAVVTNANVLSYSLSKAPANDVLVSVNGVIQKEAYNATYITYDLPSGPNGYEGDYIYDGTTNSIYFKLDTTTHTLPVGHADTKLKIGDIIQFHYLNGNTDYGAVQQYALIPNPIPVGTSGKVYQDGGVVYFDLDEDPVGGVYVMYNGVILSNSNYDVELGGGNSYRIKLLFTPATDSMISMFYSSLTANTTISNMVISPANFAELTVVINHENLNIISSRSFILGDYIALPSSLDSSLLTFGDENFFFGNLSTDIKATIYKTLFTINVLPNTFKTSANPTFNANADKVNITEIGIYDGDNDLVAIGKFSQPLVRKSYADLLVIQASIDF